MSFKTQPFEVTLIDFFTTDDYKSYSILSIDGGCHFFGSLFRVTFDKHEGKTWFDLFYIAGIIDWIVLKLK